MSTIPDKSAPPIHLTYETDEPEVDRIFNRPGKLIQEGQCLEREKHHPECSDGDNATIKPENRK